MNIQTLPSRWSGQTAVPNVSRRSALPTGLVQSNSFVPTSTLGFDLPSARPPEASITGFVLRGAPRSRERTVANRSRRTGGRLFVGCSYQRMDLQPAQQKSTRELYKPAPRQDHRGTKVTPPWALDVPENRVHFTSSPQLNQINNNNGRPDISTRAPLISLYRGEAPLDRSKSQNEINRGTKQPYDGGLFHVHVNTRQCPPYYIIHPEWLSEAMTIRQLELTPRPTSLIGHASNPRKPQPDMSKSVSSGHPRRVNNTGIHGESKSAPVNRCRSMPSRPVNPITWEPRSFPSTTDT